VRDNAQAIGGDGDRIVLAGHSAGAYNAAMLAYDQQWLEEAGVPREAIRAFAGLAGQEISVGLTRGTQKIVIEEVRDGTVLGRRQISRQNSVASTPVSFRVADLTLMEKLLRVGSDDRPAVALYKGMLALGARANRHAKGYFARTHPLLAERLVQGVEKLEHRGAESAAAAALARLLKGTGIPADPSDSNVWERAVAGLRLNEKDAAGLAGQVEAYRREHGDTEHAGAAAPLLRALLGRCEAQLPLETALPEGLEDTEQGQKTVVEMMLRRNPDLRHSEICIQGARIRGVYRVDVISPHLADIRALAAFPNLRELYLSPVSESRWRSDTPPCPLRDLRALRGLPLEVLHLVATSVKDLSPLRGMPLETLNLHATPVADLTPLQGLPLRTLDLRSTEVKNLSPLSGAPLRWLDAGDTEVVEIGGLAGVPLATLRLNRTGVKDLSALRDMPVKELDISYTEVRDLSPLRDTPLTTLRIDGTQITDLSPLRDMRVTTLSLSRTRVDSLADLRGKRIERLSVADTNVKDLSPLAGMPLTELNITGCQIRDLTALRGLPLTSLRLARTAVYELAPLEGKKIEILDISGTRVTSLKPLAAFPLRMLLCQDMEVKDYAPLRSAPLERIWIDRTEEVDALLKTMPDLEQVNGEAWNP